MKIVNTQVEIGTIAKWQSIKFHVSDDLGFYVFRLDIGPKTLEGIINYLADDMGKGYPW